MFNVSRVKSVLNHELFSPGVNFVWRELSNFKDKMFDQAEIVTHFDQIGKYSYLIIIKKN